MERLKRELNSGIYKIESITNGKIYIGSAVNIKRREKEHFNNLKKRTHVNIILQNHVNKHGVDDLVFTVIETCFKERLIMQEQYYIDTLKPEFNICFIAGSTLGLKWKEEAKQRQREINTGEMNPMYGIHKFGEDAPAYGYHHLDTAKQKQSEATKKRWLDPEYRKSQEERVISDDSRKKMSISQKNREPMSEETIQKKSTIVKNAWQDPEYREKHVKGMQGKKQSDEHIKKTSDAQKIWWADPENRERQRQSRLLRWKKQKEVVV